jgi:hypothetical protein
MIGTMTAMPEQRKRPRAAAIKRAKVLRDSAKRQQGYLRLQLKDRSDDLSIQHGTAGGYTNHQCSCPRCSAAFTSAMFVSRTRRTRRGLVPGDPRHCSQNGYGNWGCRCAACTEAHREYKKAHPGIKGVKA